MSNFIFLRKTSISLADLTFTLTDDGKNHDNTTVQLGAAPSAGEKRWMVVVCSLHGTTTTLNAPSIAGISGTIALESNAGGGQTVGMFWAEVPTGTTGTLDCDYTSGTTPNNVAIYRVISDDSTANLSVHDSASSTADPSALTVDVAAGSVVIGGVQNQAGGTLTWTNLTERAESDTNTNEWFSSAADAFATSSSARAVTADSSTTPSSQTGIIACLKPV